MRRPFFALADIEASARRKAEGKTPLVISPIALETVRRIDALFEIERAINGLAAEDRRRVRQEKSAPLVAGLESWMREMLARIASHPASRLDELLPWNWRQEDAAILQAA